MSRRRKRALPKDEHARAHARSRDGVLRRVGSDSRSRKCYSDPIPAAELALSDGPLANLIGTSKIRLARCHAHSWARTTSSDTPAPHMPDRQSMTPAAIRGVTTLIAAISSRAPSEHPLVQDIEDLAERLEAAGVASPTPDRARRSSATPRTPRECSSSTRPRAAAGRTWTSTIPARVGQLPCGLLAAASARSAAQSRLTVVTCDRRGLDLAPLPGR